MKRQYKVCHERTKDRVVVCVMMLVRGYRHQWEARREHVYFLPHGTATKDINKFKKVAVELETQKDLDKE